MIIIGSAPCYHHHAYYSKHFPVLTLVSFSFGFYYYDRHATYYYRFAVVVGMWREKTFVSILPEAALHRKGFLVPCLFACMLACLPVVVAAVVFLLSVVVVVGGGGGGVCVCVRVRACVCVCLMKQPFVKQIKTEN